MDWLTWQLRSSLLLNKRPSWASRFLKKVPSWWNSHQSLLEDQLYSLGISTLETIKNRLLGTRRRWAISEHLPCGEHCWNIRYPMCTVVVILYVSSQGFGKLRHLVQTYPECVSKGVLEFESVHWVKWIDLPNVGGPHPISWRPGLHKQAKRELFLLDRWSWDISLFSPLDLNENGLFLSL